LYAFFPGHTVPHLAMALSDFMDAEILEKIMITEWAGLMPAEILPTNSRNLKDAVFEFDHLKCPGHSVCGRRLEVGGYARVKSIS